MSAYYNEYDKFAAQWLRELIKAELIAPGEVDERSICDVKPDDLRGFTQCHFFAGIGVWSYALRRAGWDDSRPVWTGSCPCQPFSKAGKGLGFADERHLWPAFFHLIEQRRPTTVFGEQVASRNTDPWIDLVHADMEALGYAFGAVPFPSAGVGAPHIRDRLFWVADSNGGNASAEWKQCSGQQRQQPEDGSGLLWVGNTSEQSCQRDTRSVPRTQAEINAQRVAVDGGLPLGPEHASPGMVRMAYTASGGRREERANHGGIFVGDSAKGLAAGFVHGGGDQRPGPTNGIWGDADWLFCRDGKWRAVEPGTFPLANGAASRVGRLRAYGNAINAEAAIAFIEATGLV